MSVIFLACRTTRHINSRSVGEFCCTPGVNSAPEPCLPPAAIPRGPETSPYLRNVPERGPADLRGFCDNISQSRLCLGGRNEVLTNPELAPRNSQLRQFVQVADECFVGEQSFVKWLRRFKRFNREGAVLEKSIKIRAYLGAIRAIFPTADEICRLDVPFLVPRLFYIGRRRPTSNNIRTIQSETARLKLRSA